MSDAIGGEELLGFVSELKEEKGCKVGPIFNEEQLGNKRVLYDVYREVVDIELLFQPTAAEAAEIAFPPEFVYRQHAKDRAIALGVNNIRILNRAAGIIELIAKQVNQLHPKIMEQTVVTTILVVWAMHGGGKNKVPISFLKHWSDMAWHLRRASREREGEGEANEDNESAAILQDYGYTATDEFDLAVMRVVENGYVQESGLDQAAAELNARLQAGELEESFSKAWHKFHDTFSDNRAELIAELVTSFNNAVTQISPVNLDGTVRLLRQLSEDALADGLIETYVQRRGAERKLFDMQEYAFGEDVKDDKVRRRLAEHRSHIVPIPPLNDAIDAIADHNATNEAIQAWKLRRRRGWSLFNALMRQGRAVGPRVSKII